MIETGDASASQSGIHAACAIGTSRTGTPSSGKALAATGPVAAPCPGPAEERAISNNEARTDLYVAAVAAGAILAGDFAVRLGPVRSDTSAARLAAMLALLIAPSGRFPLKVSPRTDAKLFTVPLFMAALVLNLIEAALAGAVRSPSAAPRAGGRMSR